MVTTLRLHNSVLQGQGFVDVLPMKTWKRSTRLQGGYWQGSLTLRGHINDLIGPFYDWLGYHLSEQTSGSVTWEGMIYEIELAHGGSRRKRTLDLMANAVRTTFTTMDFAGPNLINEGGFELLGGGGADVFAAWEEGTGVAANTTSPKAGTYSCQLTSDGVRDGEGHFTNTYIRQNVNVQAGHQYKLSWWHRGDGSTMGNFAVRNPNAPVYWIISPRIAGYPSTDWHLKSVVFEGPSQGEALIFFYPPNDNLAVAGFDVVEMLEKTEVVYETPWAINEQSIARYGRREDFLEVDNYPLETSEFFRDTYLNEHAWPWARPMGIGPKGEASLTIQACGYVFTGNWMYATQGDDTEHDLNHWISALVGADFGLTEEHGGTANDAGDCQYLKAGSIATNELQVIERADGRDRVWDLIMEMAALGDNSGNPWRAWVDTGRLVHYQPVGLEPAYYYLGDNLYDRLGAKTAINPWTVRPGVVRDMNYPVRRYEQGSFLSDARDSLIDEVEVSGDGSIALKSALLSEADLYSAQFGERAWTYEIQPLGPPGTPGWGGWPRG